MFERYTEKARRSIFFARYEASQYGSQFIEVPHLVLGLVREMKSFSSVFGVERPVIEQTMAALCQPTGVRVATNVDLPLDEACKRVLTYGAEEAERLSHPHIGTEHLLLGVLREAGPEAGALGRLGIHLDSAREAIVRSAVEAPRPTSRRMAGMPQPATRQTVHQLLAAVPDDRLEAAAKLLAGLSGEFLQISGVSTAGPFTYSFGNPPAPAESL